MQQLKTETGLYLHEKIYTVLVRGQNADPYMECAKKKKNLHTQAQRIEDLEGYQADYTVITIYLPLGGKQKERDAEGIWFLYLLLYV